MSTRIGKAKITTKDGKTKIEAPKPRMDASKKRRIHAQAKTTAAKWSAKSKGKP